MINLIACYVVIIVVFLLIAYLTMRRSMDLRYKAFIYGALTLALLINIFEAFKIYDQRWKTATELQIKK